MAKEITAKGVGKAYLGTGITGINILIAGSVTAGNSTPISLSFFNSLGDVPFLQKTARPDISEPSTSNWDANQVYFIGDTQFDLDYFYDDGHGFLFAQIGPGKPPVAVVSVLVVDQAQQVVSYSINADVTNAGVNANAEKP